MKLLDKTNRKILNILQKDCSITNAELSTKVGLAPATTLERVKKLEKNGIIERYVALIDGEKVDRGITVFVQISMQDHTVESIKNFNDAIGQLDEVMECYRLAGEKDYLIKVVARDIKSYETFATEKLAEVPGISRLSTTFVLSTVKRITNIEIDSNID